MMSLYCLLAYIGSDKKSTEILIFVLLYVMCLFFLGLPFMLSLYVSLSAVWI